MIEFNCPHCQKRIRVSDEASGKTGTCHGCQKTIEVPIKPELIVSRAPVAQVAHTPIVQPQRVLCVYCGEDIAATAIKCKHCNEFQDGRQSVQQVQPAQQPTVVVNVSTPRYDYHQEWSPVVAVICALLFPGLGQIYKGQLLRGFLWLWVIVAGYFLFIIPGIVLQFCCLIDAATSNPNRRSY